MTIIDAQLASYAVLIEQRWRSLSDGERLQLMSLCCPACGALNDGSQRPDELPKRTCDCAVARVTVNAAPDARVEGCQRPCCARDEEPA